MQVPRSWPDCSSVSLPSEWALIVYGMAKEDTGAEYFIEGKLT
jgi:hypothetical protein